jgi:O-antigen ligase
MAQYLIITIFWGIGLTLSSPILKTRVITLTCTILSVTALILSLSRGAIIAAIIGVLFFFYLYLKTKGVSNFNKRKFVLIAVLCITTLVAGVLLSNIISDGKTFRQINNMVERSDSHRLMLWGKTINTFYSNPLTGVGLGNYSFPYHIYVHNEVLQMVAETGIIGTGGFLLFLFFVFKHSIQQYFHNYSLEIKVLRLALISGCFVTLMHSMISYNLHSATSSFFFFVGLGILCANNSKATKRGILPRNTIKRNIFILFLTVLLSFWAMQGEYKKIMGHYSFSQALLFQKQEDTSKSLGYSLKAIRYQPYNSKYHRFAGELYLKTGQSKLAKSHFQKARTLLP